jgi:hypothetical protein
MTKIDLTHLAVNVALGKVELFLAFILILFLQSVHVIEENIPIRPLIARKPTVIRWSAYSTLILGIVFLGVFKHTPFIYFQF